MRDLLLWDCMKGPQQALIGWQTEPEMGLDTSVLNGLKRAVQILDPCLPLSSLFVCVHSTHTKCRHPPHPTPLQSGSTSDFTNENNTLLLATTTVGNGDATAASAAACITLCLDDPDCTYWSWCPANETAGCTVPGINGGASSVADANACLLTYDAAADQLAVFVASGAGIAFAGGRCARGRA